MTAPDGTPMPRSIPPLPSGAPDTPPCPGSWILGADQHLYPADAQTAQMAGLSWASAQPSELSPGAGAVTEGA